ncbi:hypothetical protein [Luteolibacter luteus]|uniref:Lipoprotein n=1 Tax=Luteolibacter luteus TaxID=2728835 RepID=A0A858RHQ1_9BACT|nr:hypothetical protein [Luteolibacter luteus]QJE95949.1 hypothetical protein HHL09_09200 [Luteolibacter luteus]
MKLFLPTLLALALVSCDSPEPDAAYTDPAPILRENAELKKKVAALEYERDEAVKKHESALRLVNQFMDQKYELERKMEKAGLTGSN